MRPLIRIVKQGDDRTQAWFVFKVYRGTNRLRYDFDLTFSVPWRGKMRMLRIDGNQFRNQRRPIIKLRAFLA